MIKKTKLDHYPNPLWVRYEYVQNKLLCIIHFSSELCYFYIYYTDVWKELYNKYDKVQLEKKISMKIARTHFPNVLGILHICLVDIWLHSHSWYNTELFCSYRTYKIVTEFVYLTNFYGNFLLQYKNQHWIYSFIYLFAYRFWFSWGQS